MILAYHYTTAALPQNLERSGLYIIYHTFSRYIKMINFLSNKRRKSNVCMHIYIYICIYIYNTIVLIGCVGSYI